MSTLLELSESQDELGLEFFENKFFGCIANLLENRGPFNSFYFDIRISNTNRGKKNFWTCLKYLSASCPTNAAQTAINIFPLNILLSESDSSFKQFSHKETLCSKAKPEILFIVVYYCWLKNYLLKILRSI